MTTVFLDEVSSLFWKSSMTQANNWRSIGRISWRMASFKSFNIRGLWVWTCDFKYPQRKKSHTERLRERGGHGTSPKREMRCPENMSRTMLIDTVLNRPSLHYYWSGQPRGKECRPPCPPPRPTYWVLPIQKMSGSRGSPCISPQKYWGESVDNVINFWWWNHGCNVQNMHCDYGQQIHGENIVWEMVMWSKETTVENELWVKYIKSDVRSKAEMIWK